MISSKEQARINLIAAVKLIGGTIKTEGYYERSLSRAVRDLYGGKIDVGDFIDEQIRLIEEQFARAWNEGMRNVGLDPAKDMKPEWEDQLQALIDNEQEYVLGYAQAILDAAESGEDIQPLLDRVALWTNRYPQVVNEAEIVCGGGTHLVWRLGATEEHCETCAMLDGIVAAAEDWEASGYRPQNAPNALLECGGWRCDCSLEPTNEPVQGEIGGI